MRGGEKMKKKIIGFLLFFILIGVGIFSISSQPQTQTDFKDFVKSDSTVFRTGLLYENPELDQDGIEVSKINRIAGRLGYREVGTTSHYNYDYLPPVASQGQQNSCVGWAVGYYFKSYQENKENNRTSESEKAQASNLCSPAYIYNMTHEKNDGGSYFSDSFRVLKDFGCASLADIPYSDQDYLSWPDENDFNNAIPKKTNTQSGGDYNWLKMDSDTALNQVKQRLLNGDLVTIGINIYNYFYSLENYNYTYTIADTTGDSLGGHGLAIVGYDDTKVTNDGTGAFRLVNSWGTDWGDSGYFWMSYEAVKYDSDLSHGYVYWTDDRSNYSSDKKAIFKFSHQYSRETQTWISVGDEKKSFFDFYVNESNSEYKSFPNSNIVLDVKDLESYLTSGANVSLYMKDNEANSVGGSIGYFSYKDDSQSLQYTSYDTPVVVDDNSQGYAALTICSPTLPYISLSRSALYFGATEGDSSTQPQTSYLTNAQQGTLNWTATPSDTWIQVSPTSGTGDGLLTVTVNPAGLAAGKHTESISIADPNSCNSPKSLQITLNVYESGESALPFGSFDTPIHGSTVMSSIPVTGWVLDDIGIESVKIYRNSDNGEENPVYIGDAVLVEGARSDVEQAYLNYPNNYKAGWGYMMLTNFLPNQGNGTFVISAYANDKEGHSVSLGSKTITCDNANAVKPFGAIDTPTQGGTTSGGFFNAGWALTPTPNKIPEDGSTINVWVDGVPLGHPTYNQYRNDIATLFPGYANSSGAVGAFYLDTTTYTNGVHTIAWSVKDDAGNSDGIGSRFFNINNTGGSGFVQGISSRTENLRIHDDVENVLGMPVNFNALRFRRGFRRAVEPEAAVPDPYGVTEVLIEEVERVEIEIGKGSGFRGYMIVGKELRALPIGSTLDSEKGVFYWQPGPGFIGEYNLVFVGIDEFGMERKTQVKVRIRPKFSITIKKYFQKSRAKGVLAL